MPDKNVPIDFSNLGGKQIAPAITAKPDTPVDLSDLGGKRLDVPVPTKSVSPIDLSDLGGIRVSQHIAPEQPTEGTD